MTIKQVRVLHHHDLLQNLEIDSFIKELNQKPLRERLKFLNSKIKSNAYPRFIYKYRPLIVDHKEQVSWLRDYLVESRLWLSTPIAFNDPFDMRGRFIFEGNPEAKKSHLMNTLKEFGPDLTNQEREIGASELLAAGDFPKILENNYEQQRQNFGVCSFAGDVRNILMWAHYGSNHSGVCLQFQLAEDLQIFGRAISVEYSSEYPIMNYLADFQKSMTPTLFRKSKGWEYERERRIVHCNGANSCLTFSPSALTALVLGCEMQAASEEIVKNLLEERQDKGFPPVKIFRAFRHGTQYRLYLLRQRHLEP